MDQQFDRSTEGESAQAGALALLTPPQDDVVHVVCLDDPDRALCGSDRTGRPWVHPSTETTCEVCAALDELFPPEAA